MSFQKGVMFMGKRYIACSYEKDGRIRTWVKPVNGKSMSAAGKLVFLSMPLWYHIILGLLVLFTLGPPVIEAAGGPGTDGLPLAAILLFLAGTHFYFPRELRKYHGAEHKVFSYRDRVSALNRKQIMKAEITNRHCSTNAIVMYFFMFTLLSASLAVIGGIGIHTVINVSAAGALILMPVLTYWLNRTKETMVHRLFFRISFWLQRYVTTKQPEEHHINTAIRSYRRLVFKEFPQKVREKRKPNKKERISMVTADVSVIPVGKATTSESEQIAAVHDLLKEYEGKLTFEVNAVSTVIEAELSVLFEVLRKIHELPFHDGVKRVATNIRIDDRRDKEDSMEEKKKRVTEKANN
ncbi:MTH1187 family thiamine-binding protein [Alteribacter salitolerans]|uniref:MTH1187 family thiamine-binding protein n=1 Tax=Alteribacter salitolerans TaxID=2912333 RepID=UPI002350EF74|nr:MTH1187 family thiamine-binding protein [Alteribacter salitolerans]